MADDSATSLPPIEGGCHCRAIRYRIDVTPGTFNTVPFSIDQLPIASKHSKNPNALPFPTCTSHCMCSDCRKSVGAFWVTLIAIDPSSFHLIQGTPRTYRSSANVSRRHCENCGTSLMFARDGSPFVAVTVATFDEPDRVVAGMHVHGESAVDGYDRPDKHLMVFGPDGLMYPGDGKPTA